MSITIISQPKSVTAAVDALTKFTVTAVGVDLQYQWECKFATNTWTNIPYIGNKTATLTAPAYYWRDGYAYRCKITDTDGNIMYTHTAVLTVQLSVHITKQPQDVTAIEGDTVKFTITAAGIGLGYQWQYKSPTGTKWANVGLISGKSSSLIIENIEGHNGYSYRCKITDATGTIVYSEPATLEIIPLPFGPTERWTVYRFSSFEAEELFPDKEEAYAGQENLFQDLEDDFPF